MQHGNCLFYVSNDNYIKYAERRLFIELQKILFRNANFQAQNIKIYNPLRIIKSSLFFED